LFSQYTGQNDDVAILGTAILGKLVLGKG